MTEPRFEVLWPLGRRGGLAPTELAPRLTDLTGKRVAFVWDHVFKGDLMFARFTGAAAARYADMDFVDHPEFGNIHGTTAEEHDAVERLPERLLRHQIDAAVVGVGA
ncbi:UGSC family (seleno)protein [Actinophytocola oryzae]|uniref:UGSC-like domain-containing protein n=1 Tax=Actinophytocola oryzae TaxID=502181 RepID=A0A4R7W371_9PSEU|nr:hypothetical protein [Actinophytocola oryzae]TDV56339.1 hypothetical protein CLV71_102406 [Actinophytocola oryzae]